MTRKVCKDGKMGENMNDDKSSVAGEPMPGTQNTDLGYQPLLSGENLEFHQQHRTHAHTHACTHARTHARICLFFIEGIWEIIRKYERGKIFPSLIIIITVSSPFSNEQMRMGCGIFLLFLLFFTLFLFKLIPHHPPSWLNDFSHYPPRKGKKL